MKIDCPRKEFFEAITAALAAASVRTSVPILQNVKIEATDHLADTPERLVGVRVSGCDGEMWVVRELPCLVTEPGSLCLNARTLQQIVSQLPDGDLSLFTVDGHSAMLKQGASEYRLSSLESEDFPEPPPYGGDGELTLPLGALRSAVDSVAFAVSQDSHRQILTGVLFMYDGTTLTLVATDTHRLAVRKLHQPGIGSNVSVVVPEKALKAIKSLPVPDDFEVTLKFGDGRVGVDAGGAHVVSQLLAGTYPNWERVVPQEHTRVWTAEVDQLAEKVKRAMIIARESSDRVRFKGDGDQIVIAARSETQGEAKEEVVMVAENGDVEIAFNGRYVADVLNTLTGPGVRIEMTESSRSAVFKSADDDGTYLCVIMPMALA
jgi:DNA polymerase-3 subunit beta